MGDERLAKWSRVAWENSMDESPEGVHSIKDALMALADSESADLRAALVVVREQLTREQAAIHADLTALLEALGMGTHARPESPHQVMTACIEAARSDREQLTQAQAENATLREDYARLLSRWDDEREARIRAEGPAARWCQMPRAHEPHLWTCDGETTLCPGYHPSPPTYTTEEPS